MQLRVLFRRDNKKPIHQKQSIHQSIHQKQSNNYLFNSIAMSVCLSVTSAMTWNCLERRLLVKKCNVKIENQASLFTDLPHWVNSLSELQSPCVLCAIFGLKKSLITPIYKGHKSYQPIAKRFLSEK